VRTAATLYLKHDAAPFMARIEKALRPSPRVKAHHEKGLDRAAETAVP
jgi:hypothetical protein